ncbi:MAG: discoidin domain-containing protein, partial [Prevotella sp.]|nr:discoidin domain-containing protein [Prevotella sp.]
DDTYRNLSYQHPAYHSSSYDYNLTAQLVTDGIITTGSPARVEVLVNGRNLPRNEREYAFDGNDWNRNVLTGSNVTFRINWLGMTADADSVVLNCTVAYRKKEIRGGYEIRFSDGENTLALDRKGALPGKDTGYGQPSDPNKQTERGTLPARVISKGYRLTNAAPLATLLLEMNMTGAEYWTISDIKFFKEGRAVDTALLPMSRFVSAWMSADGGEQWIYTDLGAPADISEVRLYWLEKAPEGRIEVSDNASDWTVAAALPQDELTYSVPVEARGRYVRVSVEGQDEPYMLSEMEVYGRGGTIVTPCEAPKAENRMLSLDGGDWRLQRVSEVNTSLEEIASDGFNTDKWIVATVPATVLGTYVNAGAVPDQNYDDNTQYASESYFYSGFYYRREFVLPASFAGKELFLNLDGINWKAAVYLNGQSLGRVEGAFMRGRMNITALVRAGRNVLVVAVEPPAHPGATKEKNYMLPGANGGLLGMDNPTFHASVGWDWIPSVRGRETGIWNDIYISAEDLISLSDPFVLTSLNLPDTLATMLPEVCWHNFSGRELSGTIEAWIGDICVKKAVSVSPGIGRFTFRPDEFPAFRRAKMRLWYPNGYGEPYLYDAGFRFIDGVSGDTLSVVTFRHGVRQITYEDVDTALKIFVNGKRIVPMGGNWGFSEQNMNYRRREYEAAVRYHKEMNFNMIRNWVGQTADEEFYEACDKYGILVWQDFWLANPADGPDPADETLFESNALDYVARIRRHPCIALYCGRNEGYPPATLDKSLRQITSLWHPGIAYISSSADGGVSGHGPYNALPAKEYFEHQTGLLHSERGMPNILTYESLARTMRPEHRWPQGDVWGQHDYTMTGAQKGESFNALVAARFGTPQSAEEFASRAQLINFEGYRAMFESGAKDRMGLLIWMSHACWPSMSWQTYDYFMEPTAAYFGCRKACEPLHIQRNASTGKAEVVNLGIGDFDNLKARIETFNLDGRRLRDAEMNTSSPSDTTVELIETSGDVVRLRLFDDTSLVSENTYILAEDLSNLQPARVETLVADSVCTGGDVRSLTVNVQNKGSRTAYMLRLNLVDGEGVQILPVVYSDNYFTLFPGERKDVTVAWAAEDQHSDGARVELTGLNLAQ